MTFEDLLFEIKRVKCEETRFFNENALEVVIAKSRKQLITDLLESYFGPPLKAEGAAPSGDANRYAEPYGGIRREQTMYYRKSETCSDLALIWPWGSGDSVTVKVFRG